MIYIFSILTRKTMMKKKRSLYYIYYNKNSY